MITIPTSVLFAIISLGFVATPINLSLFCKNKKINKYISSIGLVLFALITFVLTLNNVSIGLEYVKINFATTGEWFSKVFKFWNGNLKDYILNTLMFVPVGLITTQHYMTINQSKSKAFIKSILTGFTLSLLVEISQFALPINRFPAFNDILFNTISAGVGAVSLNTLTTVKKMLSSKNISHKYENDNSLVLNQEFQNKKIYYTKKLNLNTHNIIISNKQSTQVVNQNYKNNYLNNRNETFMTCKNSKKEQEYLF